MVNHGEIKEQDLIKDHKALIKSFMETETEWDLSTRKKVLNIYDALINKENIRYYINREIKIFIVCLIKGDIKRAAKYFPKGYLDN